MLALTIIICLVFRQNVISCRFLRNRIPTHYLFFCSCNPQTAFMRYLYTRIIPQNRAILFLLLSFILGGNLSAQIVRIDNPTDSVAFCSGFFVDQGVFNGPHSSEGADTVTICSNKPEQNAYPFGLYSVGNCWAIGLLQWT